MGSADRIRVAAQILAAEKKKRPVLAVVSAMSKVTDLLLETLRRAEAGDLSTVASNVRALEERHFDACRDLLPPQKQGSVLAGMHSILIEFERIASGIQMLGERPPRSVDEAVIVGERLSALLMASFLESQGIASAAINGADAIVTDAVFGNATPLMGPTCEKSGKLLLPLLEQGVLPVVTGFNGSTTDGKPTTLGRGGSDFSASILAASLDAEDLWIWTDVDGIMTADPRVVKDACVLPKVSYREAAELAYNGAKVLHPRTLAPLIEKRIPVWSKNSFNLNVPGTQIVESVEVQHGARAVTSMANVALLAIEPARAAVSGTRVMARALDALAAAGSEVLALSSSSYQQNFCVLIRQDEVPRALESLQESLALELAHGYVKPIDVDTSVGLLAVVGEGMRGTAGLAGRIFTAISREKINIIAIAQGSSELTIAVVVRRDGLEKAVKAVHAECQMGAQACQ